MVKTKTHNKFVESIFQLVGHEYKVIGSYEKARNKILMKHTICGHTYEVTPSHFVPGTRSPYCNENKGERIIKNYLETHNILFKKNLHSQIVKILIYLNLILLFLIKITL
ncbi:hypothetical protein [Bacillus thuringiensis]|uniref:hypothetical protein n=1 Tax=Bacillus thuringiensis TaxID=1428 RepID=UPI003459E7B7